MAELKTKQNDQSVTDFLKAVPDEHRRDDSFVILDLMKEITGQEPKMWGDSIIGFGNYRYKYATGREGNWFVTGFSPRKQNLTLYIMSGFDQYDELLKKPWEIQNREGLFVYQQARGCGDIGHKGADFRNPLRIYRAWAQIDFDQ